MACTTQWLWVLSCQAPPGGPLQCQETRVQAGSPRAGTGVLGGSLSTHNSEGNGQRRNGTGPDLPESSTHGAPLKPHFQRPPGQRGLPALQGPHSQEHLFLGTTVFLVLCLEQDRGCTAVESWLLLSPWSSIKPWLAGKHCTFPGRVQITMR